MIDRQVGDPVWHDAPAKLALDDLFRHHAATGERHRREELSIRHLRQALPRTTHADEAFDQIVIRFQFRVADGPVFSVAVMAGRFEFVVAEAITLARPAKGFSTYLSPANPHERFVWWESVRMLQIIHEELMTVLVAGIAQALDGLGAQKLLLIPEAAKFQLVGPNMFGEIAGRHAWRSRLQHQDGQATLGQFLGDPAATRS